jgi:hypothetical protein
MTVDKLALNIYCLSYESPPFVRILSHVIRVHALPIRLLQSEDPMDPLTVRENIFGFVYMHLLVIVP